MVNLESVSECLQSEIDELQYELLPLLKKDLPETKQLRSIISNLRAFTDQVYKAFEELPSEEESAEIKRPRKNFLAMIQREILPRLTWKDLQYIKHVYNIDLEALDAE